MKKNKISHKKNTKGTLDQKHTEKILKFEKLNNSLPKKKRTLKKYIDELTQLSNTDPKMLSREDIRRKVFLNSEIKNITCEINSIENCNESLQYIVGTLPILVDYYNNQTDVSNDIDEEFINNNLINDKTNVISYFIKESVKNEEKNQNNKSANVKQKINKAKLYDTYLNITEFGHRKTTNTVPTICTKKDCDGEMILNQNDGYLVCVRCGLVEPILITTDKSVHKEQTQDINIYAYKRINHLQEILSQLQAKESTKIHEKVYQAIYRELKKKKIDKYDLDIFKLRRILKRLDFRKYYEHVPHILQNINGREPPNFNRSDENRIRTMFRDIQKPFAIYCPKDRKNFLNYSYVLHKFCELLGLDEYIEYFPLLKNSKKLLHHDKIWKNICTYMRWEFIKSI